MTRDPERHRWPKWYQWSLKKKRETVHRFNPFWLINKSWGEDYSWLYCTKCQGYEQFRFVGEKKRNRSFRQQRLPFPKSSRIRIGQGKPITSAPSHCRQTYRSRSSHVGKSIRIDQVDFTLQDNDKAKTRGFKSSHTHNSQVSAASSLMFRMIAYYRWKADYETAEESAQNQHWYTQTTMLWLGPPQHTNAGAKGRKGVITDLTKQLAKIQTIASGAGDSWKIGSARAD
ncbi:hypothetical protein BJ742DRAFT_866629 [Cladochytrium replicatum]|nr:hypothetical protein BJ742DRAFT_866629 [Cladochytrium replicatum]